MSPYLFIGFAFWSGLVAGFELAVWLFLRAADRDHMKATETI